MASDREFLEKRDYTPSEMVKTIRDLKSYMNIAVAIKPIQVYDPEDNLVLALVGKGYVDDNILTLNDLSVSVEQTGT